VKEKISRRSFVKRFFQLGMGSAAASMTVHSNIESDAAAPVEVEPAKLFTGIQSIDDLIGGFSPGDVIAIESAHNETAEIFIEEITKSCLTQHYGVIHASIGTQLNSPGWQSHYWLFESLISIPRTDRPHSEQERYKAFGYKLLESIPFAFLWLKSEEPDEITDQIARNNSRIKNLFSTRNNVVFLTGTSHINDGFLKHRTYYRDLKKFAEENDLIIFTNGHFNSDLEEKSLVNWRGAVLSETDYSLIFPRFNLEKNKLSWPSSMTMVPIHIFGHKNVQAKESIDLYMDLRSGYFAEESDIRTDEEVDANVVVTYDKDEETRLAVYLQYHGKGSAPKCILKGNKIEAAEIIDAAKERDIPVINDPPIARALYLNVEKYEEIPKSLYQSVACIFGMATKKE